MLPWGVLLVLPLEAPELPKEEAGSPPLLPTCGGRVTEPLLPPPPSWPVPPVDPEVEPPDDVDAGLLDAPGELLPEDGAPEVSGMAGMPLEPLLPPLRLSGDAGVRVSTPPEVPAAVPAFFEPAFPDELPAAESGLLPQAASPSARIIAGVASRESRQKFLADALEKPFMQDSRELEKRKLPSHG